MKTIAIVLVILFITSAEDLISSLANKKNIDSLLSELKMSKDDTNQVNLLYRLSFEYEEYSIAEGIKYGLQGVKLAKKISFKRGEADCILRVGENYFARKDFDNSILHYNKALSIYHQLGDKHYITNCLSHIANLYSTQSNYPELLRTLNQLLTIKRGLDDKPQIAEELNNIGLVNLYLSRYNVALKSFNESYYINTEIKDTIGMGFNLVNSARVFKEINEIDKALNNFFKGLKIFKKENDIYNVSRINYFIAEIYYLQNKFDKSLIYVDQAINEIPLEKKSDKLQIKEYARSLLLKSELLFRKQEYIESFMYSTKALDYSKEIYFRDGIALSYSSLGKLHLAFTEDSILKKIPIGNASITTNKTANLDLSIKNFLLAEDIFSTLGELNKRSINLKYLSQAYKAKGDIGRAFTYYQDYISLKDSIFNKENAMNIGKLESDFEYKIKLTNSEKNRISAEKNEALSKSQNTLLLFGITTLLLLTLIFIWLYFQRRKNIRILEDKNNLIGLQKTEIDNKNEQLMKMNIAKDKIFGTISHDLRNTLKGFMIGTKNLQQKSQQDNSSELFYINQSANRMNDLMESLLLYADQNFQQYKVEFEYLDLSKFINEAINLYSDEILSKDLKVLKSFNFLKAHTNESYVGVIIRNIIHNAIKFSPIGGIIEVALSQEDNYTILTVKDFGIGISSDDIEKVNNYQRPQIQTPIGEISKGTGFGLVTAKEFIEKVDGNLFIESTVGKGTTVLLYFQS